MKTLTLTFNPMRAIVMTIYMQKVNIIKGHSVQKLAWKQTDKWTEVIALPRMLMWSVVK